MTIDLSLIISSICTQFLLLFCLLLCAHMKMKNSQKTFTTTTTSTTSTQITIMKVKTFTQHEMAMEPTFVCEFDNFKILEICCLFDFLWLHAKLFVCWIHNQWHPRCRSFLPLCAVFVVVGSCRCPCYSAIHTERDKRKKHMDDFNANELRKKNDLLSTLTRERDFFSAKPMNICVVC